MKYWYLDIEISGTRAFDEVIEVAILECDSENARLVWIFDSLISGVDSITSPQELLTGITMSALTQPGLPQIGSVVQCLLGIPEDALLVSYSLQFDLDFICHTAELNGIQNFTGKTFEGICLLEEVKSLTGKHVSLDDALGITRDNHRASTDAKLHFELHKRLKRLKKINSGLFKANRTPKILK
ncbi:Exonuclease domain-containing protein [Vibrio chagasii]|uniref:hypothetical protein n=1 Tax=Vibrio splendidus TaxID=29497 RepID=UPI00338CE0E0|nr:Exonuclease domain-containing protein [Vibrio chagasii]CAH6963435.1 Exonuclease domain-containing protein [Vibrio chagasii]